MTQLELEHKLSPGEHQHLICARRRGPPVDRYQLKCRPVRDLLVEYLRERQPALDYTSLDSLANHLGKRFWADIEAHHPHVTSLALPRDVAADWKRRLKRCRKQHGRPVTW